MNLNLKAHPFFAHFIPGCFAAIIIVTAHFGWSFVEMNRALSNLSSPVIFALLAGTFILAEFIDSIRDIVEGQIDKHYEKINWDHLLTSKNTEANLYVFENFYFTYYVFCANSFAAILVALLGCQIDRLPTLKCKAITALVLMAGTFLCDAKSLRHELVERSKVKKGASDAK